MQHCRRRRWVSTCRQCAESMRSYFLPSRFYSREYPFTRVKAGMVHPCMSTETCSPLNMSACLALFTVSSLMWWLQHVDADPACACAPCMHALGRRGSNAQEKLALFGAYFTAGMRMRPHA